MKQKPDVANNQLQPAPKVFYEKTDLPHIINPQNPQNPVYDTSCRPGAQDIDNSSSKNGYELMASVKIRRDVDSTIPLQCDGTHESDHYIQMMEHPLYHNITPGQHFANDERKTENSNLQHQSEL